MKNKILFFFLAALLTATAAQAQKADKQLTVKVTSVEGDNLKGQPIVLTQTQYEVGYGTLKLDADGVCQKKVYAGPHNLSITRDGFEPLSYDFIMADDQSELTVEVTLVEKTRTPFALTATVQHDAYTGQNSIDLSWNVEPPAFFDDFESYDGWAVNFGDWTGIDADNEAAAALLGSYPNRGVMQYAQIINPLTVEPTWWYDYPILRPYGGHQYVGFTRTSSGRANDDWLITPTITVGTDNIFSFMGKAADQFTEMFMVYVTTNIDNPVQADFTRIDLGNYETADYKGWKRYSYDLSAYAGQQVKLAIRYISEYNRYGSFMLMVDDVFVGQAEALERMQQMPARTAANLGGIGPDGSRIAPKGHRVSPDSRRSPANPNEVFTIFLDGEQVGQTDDYQFTLTDIAAGDHTIGLQASYKVAQSELVTLPVSIPADGYSHVTFAVTANSILSADGQQLQLVSIADASEYLLTVADGKAELLSLPNGQYVVNVEEGAFMQYQQTITVSTDSQVDIILDDYMREPSNITARQNDEGLYVMQWNQELLFTDSFEEYDDFASGSFGQWITIDRDQQPVYPIGLGGASNIVTFPGSGTATNPTAITPLVFNPWHTQPAMLPEDVAVAAPTGDKTVIFFSPQMAKADKWLISPLLTINRGYSFMVTAKAYTSAYPERMEFCISDGSTQPADFIALSEANPLAAEQWTIYSTDLSDYEGQQVRLAVHYVSTDAFFAQVDDFSVGPEDGQGATVDYGNVVRFDIFLDGTKIGETTQSTFTLPTALSAGRHVVGIKAIYLHGDSMAEYVIDIEATGIDRYPIDHSTFNVDHSALTIDHFSNGIYDLGGRRVGSLGDSSFSRSGKVTIANGHKVAVK